MKIATVLILLAVCGAVMGAQTSAVSSRDDFPWLKSRLVNEAFIFLFGVNTGALGLYFLQVRASRSNKRRS